MIIKKVLTILLAVIIGYIPCQIYAMDPQGQNMPQIDVSPDQLQKMETMMGEMQKFYNNLSDQEKAQFENELATEVAKEQQKLESMNPDQQKEYIETAFQQFDHIDLDALIRELEEEDMERAPSYRQERSTADITHKKDKDDKKKQEEEEKKKKIGELRSKIKKILKHLQDLTKKLDNLHGPNAEGLIGTWILEDKKWIGAPTSYRSFRDELNELINKLIDIRSAKDKKTKEYYYLNDIKATEKLSGQLDGLHRGLKDYEPLVETIELEHANELKDESIPPILKQLITQILKETKIIIPSLNELIKKFEGKRGKELKKEEEHKTKTAQTELKRGRWYSRGRTTVAGKPEKFDTGTGYDYETGYDKGYGYGDSAYGYESGDSGYPPSQYTDYGDVDVPDTRKEKETPTTTGDKAPTTKEPSKDKEVDKATPVAKKDPAAKLDSELKKLDSKSANILATLEDALDDFEDAWVEEEKKELGIKFNKNWKQLNNYLMRPEIEKDPYLLEKAQEAGADLSKAEEETKRFAKKIKKQDKKVREKFKTKVNNLHKKYNPIIQVINETLEKASEIEKDQLAAGRYEEYQIIRQLGKLGLIFEKLNKAF